MSPLRIYTTKDTEVRETSRDLTTAELKTPEIQTFADELIEAMIRFEGIGIASCQVGKTIRMVVIAKEYAHTNEHILLINPRIVSTGNKKNRLEEGCLSVPGTYGIVERESKIRIKALDRYGESVDIKAKGMYARIIQHEIDHLNGKLFIDIAEKITKEEPLIPIER